MSSAGGSTRSLSPHLDYHNVLPVYYTVPRGRQNVSRGSPFLLEDEHDARKIVNDSELSLNRHLPNYSNHGGFELPVIKPLTPKVVEVLQKDTSIPAAPANRAAKQTDRMEVFLTWFDLYRKLFAVVMLLNIAALIALVHGKFNYAQRNVFSFALGNLLCSVLARNEFALRIAYWLVVNALFWTPIRIRNLITALFVNLGGVHSGCSTAGLLWTCYAAYVAFKANTYPTSVLVFTILTPVALSVSIAVAMPYVRHNHHNIFEAFHRFVGWLGLAYLWVLVILLQSYDAQEKKYRPSHVRWVEKQEFWFSVILSMMIVAPWVTLQKIPITVSSPSPKIAFLSFPGGCYTGLLGRLSRSPWLEWHAFGIISEGPMAFTHHMLVVAQGDWTKALISNPPKFVWTRGLKFAGLPYLAEMYERGVIVATGAGIGVTLSVYLQTKGHFHLIWIGSDMEKTYGNEIMTLLHKAVKGDRVTIVDTKKTGRPDTVQLIDNIYRKIDAQVVFITSNPKGTEVMVNGCRERGMTAFGPLFDS